MEYAKYVQILTIIVVVYCCTMDMYEYYELKKSKKIVRVSKITESECLSCFNPPPKPESNNIIETDRTSEIPRAYETEEYATCLGCDII